MNGAEKIIIHGAGSTAQLVGLALHQSGFAIDLVDPIERSGLPDAAPGLATINPADPLRNTDWQRVLALAPASKVCLEKLGVWQKLTMPTAVMTGMEVRRGPVGQGLPTRLT